MQNKYKLPDHVRAAALAVVKSYEPFKHDIEKEENECKYSFVQAVENALDEILKGENQIYSLKLRRALLRSCECGRKFNFDYSGIDCMSRSTFYRRKNQFLYLIADKLGQIWRNLKKKRNFQTPPKLPRSLFIKAFKAKKPPEAVQLG